MRESIAQSIRSSFNHRWGNLPAGRRVTIGLVTAAVIAGIIGLALWSSKPDYTVLCADLSPEGMQAVEDEIRLAGIRSKKSPDGSSILVPSSELEKMRWRLAEKGVPEAGNIGFEIFDKSDYFATDASQQVKYQRALQTELARTIKQIPRVRAARVHLVLPRPTVFVEQEQPSTASVALLLRPGVNLNPEQVDGIVFLVAGAVAGLQQENVTVVDTSSGKIISTGNRDSYVDGSRLRYQQAVESKREAAVRDMLVPVLGYGNTAVQVSAEVDYKSITTTARTYSPDGAVPRSETTNDYTSKNTGGPGNASGVPGVTSNITPGAQSGANWPEYSRTDSTIEYELSESVTDTIYPPGEITKLSVAVVVNETFVEEKILSGTSASLTKAQVLKEIQSLVGNATGIDGTRDNIQVTSLPFDTSVQQELVDAEKASKREQLYKIVIKAVISIAVFAFLLFILRSVLKRASLPNDMLAIPESAGTLMSLPSEGAALARAEVNALSPGADMPLQEAERQEAARVTEEIPPAQSALDRQAVLDVLKEDPERVAQIIRGWLAE